MDKDKLNKLVENVNIDFEKTNQLVLDLVDHYTKPLDITMKEINDNIICMHNPPTSALETYFLRLTNMYYYVAPQCEILGLQGDIAKSAVRVKYNEAYGNKQAQDRNQNKKPTVKELETNAEMESLDEELVSAIYSRSYRIVKAKLEAANTMIATLSKIITTQDNERRLTGVVNV